MESLDSFAQKNCCLHFIDSNFQHPTPEEVKVLRKLLGLSQVGLAKLVGVNFSEQKGSTTVRRWETSVENKKNHRVIPYAVWRLMLMAANIISVENDLNIAKTFSEQ